jgi:signal transduction histidine kinase
MEKKLIEKYNKYGQLESRTINSVLAKGRYDIANNIIRDAEWSPWYKFLVKNHINSSVVFPLKVEEKIVGIMAFYSSEYNFDDEEEIHLLQNLCDDLSFAIKAIELEKISKISEENKRLLNEAREYDNLKTEFFANISHELRTPINIILSAIQLLNIYFTDASMSEDKDKIGRYFYSIQQNSYRLLRLISNIIDITKIDAGYFEVNLQNHNIVSVVEDLTLSVSEYIEHKGITLLFDTDVEEKNMAFDSDKIDRVMLNLLSNAVKFTKPGGTITVNVYDKGDKVLIKVKDDGIGIPEDKKDIVFQRFRQVDKSLTRSHEGSGIGLSIVKSLVELHGGKIYLESQSAKGTEFTVELPVKIVGHSDATSLNSIAGESLEKINIEFSDIP